VDCPACPELDLGEWGEELLAQLEGRRYPLHATLELTERCNLACAHCYINQPAGSLAARACELTTAQLAEILNQMADAGCLFLLITGGEPLLRPDFVEVYRHVRQRGMIVTLFTNGTLLTPRIADLLADTRPFVVDVTLYGATAETYERVTRVPGSFSRCMQGIELLLNRDLPLTLKSVLTTLNRHELPAMRALADKFGVNFRYDGTLWPRLDGGGQPFAYRLTVKEMIALDREDPERQQAWDEQARLLDGQLVRNEYIYSCGAGVRSFHVDSAGRMSICTMARRPAYDLRQMNFQQGWERLGALRRRKRRLDTECRTCTIGALCSQCPGWSQAVHGDNETPVEFVCQLGKRRAAQVRRIGARTGENA
jgi:radical SAM protein with 4Fe4S-binding SPASM domain